MRQRLLFGKTEKSASFVGTLGQVGNACKSPDEERGTESALQYVQSTFRDGQGTLADMVPLGTRLP